MSLRIPFSLCFACLLGAFCRLPAGAAMSGGAFSVPVLATLSGGAPASGGALSLSGLNMGGPVFSGPSLSGGVFSLESGPAQTVVIFENAAGDLAGAHCYPVPYKPSRGDTVITFTGLTPAASVKIFTLSGRLVRALEKSGTGATLAWDVKNSGGEDVASGVYLYIVKGAGQTRTGKLMVIR